MTTVAQADKCRLTMRGLADGERRNLALGKGIVTARPEILVCEATAAECIVGQPLKVAGQEPRWPNYAAH